MARDEPATNSELGPRQLRTAGTMKLALAKALVSWPMARIVSLATRHRIPNFGLVFDTSDPIISPRVEAQLFWRIYESAEIRFARRYLAGCTTVVDLGSSLGFAAAHTLSVMSRTGRLISVEANASLIPTLRRTLAAHAGRREVIVRQAALAYGGERVRMDFPDDALGGRISSQGEEVASVTLSCLLAEHGVEDYALLADLEGAEAEILKHDSQALRRCKRAVIELHDTPRASVAELIEEFRRAGLAVADQHGPVAVFVR